jgi:hypothetical protein
MKSRRIGGVKRDDPLIMYIAARAFWYAAEAINAQHAESLRLWPYAANQSFSLELHLKCLHRLRRRRITGHNVQRIFERLGKADQKRITRYLAERLEQIPEFKVASASGIPFDIHSVLMRASDMFTKSRYWYELELPAADAKGYSGTHGIGQLIDAVNRYIIELRPDWPNMAANFRLTLPQRGLLPT